MYVRKGKPGSLILIFLTQKDGGVKVEVETRWQTGLDGFVVLVDGVGFANVYSSCRSRRLTLQQQ